MIGRMLRRAALRQGIWVTRSTPEADVRRLLSRLKPVSGTIPLRRIGPDGDGGYVIPDDLDGVSAMLSPGVAGESRFDLEIAKTGVPVFMADASVSGPAISHPLFHFSPVFLGGFSGGRTRTLRDWVEGAGVPAGDLILQIDIEGDEYATLAAVPEELMRRFRMIIIELHHLEELFNARFFRQVSAVLAKIAETHEVVHVHPNNVRDPFVAGGLVIPHIVELTYHRRDRDTFQSGNVVPAIHPLDHPNVPGRPPLPLPDCFRA